MRLKLLAVDKKTGTSHTVYGVHMNKAGNITKINLEPKEKFTTWEPIKDFHLLPIDVHISNEPKEVK